MKGINKFFTATYIDVNGVKNFYKDENSFKCFTCLEGEGRIGDVSIHKGESVFVPAGFGKISVEEGADIVVSTL